MTEDERLEGFLIDLRAATIKHGVVIDSCPCGCHSKLMMFVRENQRHLLPSCRYGATRVNRAARFQFLLMDS